MKRPVLSVQLDPQTTLTRAALMLEARQQRTIGNPTSVEGFGYWSGKDIRLEFRPAEANSGIVFVRSDLQPAVRIPARVEHRVESPRRTTLRAGSGSVEMVEHVMAALAGLHIDNCEVWADGAEMPGLDGSALAYVEALLAAGIEEQSAVRSQLIVSEQTRVGDSEQWIEARPNRSAAFEIKYRLDYGRDNAIGRQTLAMKMTPDAFHREIAPCRTFLLEDEAKWLRSQGLGTRASESDLLVYGAEGPIGNELRFADECVRHKVLDFVGDVALAGCDLIGTFTALRSGHRLNAELVRALLAEGEIIGDKWRRTA